MKTLSVVVPCFNEEKTIKKCLQRLLSIQDHSLKIEIIVVDDCSTDSSVEIILKLSKRYNNIKLIKQLSNFGKGAALRVGFKNATGKFIAIQDADLEYNPNDLKRLMKPLLEGKADVVFGSRFIASEEHRVLYFWHSLGNKLLTFISNMFTDLNLTDMETGYKIFRRDVIQKIELKENRFGFEPEIVAKLAHLRIRIYEMGISYSGRTYEEGKKIKARDGIRALYCIVKYNAPVASTPLQLLLYLIIGGIAAIINYAIFTNLNNAGININYALWIAFSIAAFLNYFLCIAIVFRHRSRWNSIVEVIIFIAIVITVGMVDWASTKSFIDSGVDPKRAKLFATAIGFLLNFIGRRYLVFPEPSSGPWH